MQGKHWVLLVPLAVLLMAGSGAADTTICTVIPAPLPPDMPYYITAQGNYCLDRNLSTPLAATTWSAIVINSDFVVLDLNGFKIGGGSAGAGTQSNGVYALNRKNITIKNGNIRGFYRAVFLQETGTAGTSAGHTVEGIRADGNTYAGIWVEGVGNSVRDNQVVTTGGTTVSTATEVYGIRVEGSGARVLNNDVTDTKDPTRPGKAIVLNAAGSVLQDNRVGNGGVSPPPGSVGVAVEGGADVLAARNMLLGLQTGISYVGGSTGKYRDNVSAGVTVPYTGTGQNAGNNQ
jgi:hypothetical protein